MKANKNNQMQRNEQTQAQTFVLEAATHRRDPPIREHFLGRGVEPFDYWLFGNLDVYIW